MRKFTATVALSGLAVVLSGASAHAAGLPQLNIETFPPQVIWLVISFVALYIIMAKGALPRVGQILEERQHRIDDNLTKAEQLKGEAEAAAQAYETSLANSRAQAQELMRAAREAAADAASARQTELSDRLGKEIADAEARISDARAEAMGDAKTVAAEVAADVVSRLSGESLDAKDAAKAVAAVSEEGK